MDWVTENKIGLAGSRALCEALATNTTLTQLDLRGEQQDKSHKHRTLEHHRRCTTTDCGVYIGHFSDVLVGKTSFNLLLRYDVPMA